MRRCFLHIGTHKTGTTAIQVQLNNHRDRLAQRGFLYPKTGIPDKHAGHHNIAWQLRGDHRFKPESGTLNDLFLEIDKSEHDIILSSEDFECTADKLGSFISKLEQHGCKVAVVIYFRDQLTYSRSLYIELISVGYDRTFDHFLSEIIEHKMVEWREWVFAYDYRSLLSLLPQAATIIARSFCRETSVIGDFTSIVGLSPSDLKIDPEFRIHVQRPTSAAVANFYYNQTNRNIRRDYKSIMRLISRAFDGADIDLSVPSKQRLVGAFEASNRWMDERYGMPVLANMGRDIVSQALSSSPCLDLEAVFSTAALNLIGALCESESRRKWTVFGWRPRR
jgi:hypothetical protein